MTNEQARHRGEPDRAPALERDWGAVDDQPERGREPAAGIGVLERVQKLAEDAEAVVDAVRSRAPIPPTPRND
jgi:hypothetical protein